MSNNQSTPPPDAMARIGTIVDATAGRDAVHVNVLPAQAGELLFAGYAVRIYEGKAYICKHGNGIGIVDPFLPDAVRKDEYFYVFIYPRKVTSLRHVWTHPDIPDEVDTANAPEQLTIAKDIKADTANASVQPITITSHPASGWGQKIHDHLIYKPGDKYEAWISTPINESESYLQRFAHKINYSYPMILEAAAQYLKIGEEVVQNTMEYESISDEDWKDFWYHYENIMKQEVPPDRKECFFRCSCG